MTAPITDTCIFEGGGYAVIAANNGRLMSPDQFGMKPRMWSTACNTGFYATLKISGKSLILTRLVLKTKNDIYPPIAGIKPKYDDREFAWVYSGLSEIIPHSGKIRLGKWLDNWNDDQAPQNIALYAGYHGDDAASKFDVIVDVTLRSGSIVEIEDRSDEIDSIKNDLNPIPEKLFVAVNCLY